ncbi:MAG: hypothetical protein M1436_06925 [Acidobacteria bacterium]|nr:hypothetical protein [Acidobacteriota bacterium]
MRTFTLAAAFSMMVFCAGLQAAKQRPWQDGHVVKIQQSEEEYETTRYRSSAAIGGSGAMVPDGVEKHHRKIWTYYFKSSGKTYSGQVEKKPLADVKEGDDLKIFRDKDTLYVLPTGGKERKLEFLKIE